MEYQMKKIKLAVAQEDKQTSKCYKAFPSRKSDGYREINTHRGDNKVDGDHMQQPEGNDR